jgi:hypothetical protein
LSRFRITPYFSFNWKVGVKTQNGMDGIIAIDFILAGISLSKLSLT